MKIVGLLLIALVGCQKLKPTEINIPEYPDLKAFYLSQAEKLSSSSLRKQVRLDDKSEIQSFQFDTLQWEEELSFFKEMNPSQPEYVGVFDKEVKGNEVRFTLKEGEKGILKKLLLVKKGGQYSSISATIHEDKYVYIHHREVEVTLKDEVITSFDIQGYQNVILQDTVRFGINGKVSLK
ncbi:MAG: hypothetical protein ABJL37_11765 [Ekhidna sp.]